MQGECAVLLTVGGCVVLAGLGRVHAWQSRRNAFEECLDIDADFCTGFHELDAQFIGLRLAVFRKHLPLLGVIYLISHEEDDQVVAADGAGLLDPAVNVVEARLGCDVVANDGHAAVVYVAGNERTEPLLPCCVPKLQAHHFVIDEDILGKEVDPNRCL